MKKEKNLPYAVFGFGEYIFHFYKIKDGIRLDVCNWLRTVQGSYFFKTADELKQLAFNEKCALRFYIGGYGYASIITENHWNNNFLPCLKKNEVFETIS